MSNKKEFWTIIWDVVKFILTLGISHIAKRKERLESKSDPESPDLSVSSQLLRSYLKKSEKLNETAKKL